MRARTLVCGCYCMRTAYTGLALPTTSLGHSFELKAYFGSADNPGLMQALRFRILPMQGHNLQGGYLVGQDYAPELYTVSHSSEMAIF